MLVDGSNNFFFLFFLLVRLSAAGTFEHQRNHSSSSFDFYFFFVCMWCIIHLSIDLTGASSKKSRAFRRCIFNHILLVRHVVFFFFTQLPQDLFPCKSGNNIQRLREGGCAFLLIYKRPKRTRENRLKCCWIPLDLFPSEMRNAMGRRVHFFAWSGQCYAYANHT